MNENNNLGQPQNLGEPSVLGTSQPGGENVNVTPAPSINQPVMNQNPQVGTNPAQGISQPMQGTTPVPPVMPTPQVNTVPNTANPEPVMQQSTPTPNVEPAPQSAPTEPVATPIPGTENANSNMPSNSGGIGADPSGITLGNVGSGYVEPTKIEDIGAVPPKQEKPKRPMNKVLFIIIIIVLIAAVAFGVYYYLNMSNNKANVNLKEVIITLGETVSDNINDYATITGGGASSCTLNNNNVNANALGDYNFTITCGDDSYSGTVHVVDETAPTAELKVAYKVVNTTSYSIDDFVESCTDASNCSYSFADETAVQNYLTTAGGPYDIGIILTDEAGNEKAVNAVLYVAPYDITAIRECTSPETSIEGYEGTMTVSDNLLIGRSDNGLNYMGLSRRVYTYTFTNEQDYLNIIGDKPEVITFNNVAGLASYDDTNHILTISADLPQATLDLEAGGTFDVSYGGFSDYYEDNLGYTCINNMNVN